MIIKRLILIAKIVIVLAVSAYLAWELHKSWGKIHQTDWQANYLWLTLAGVFYIAAFVPSAVFWRYAMRSFGQSPGLYESFRAYYIGHLGKYVPGKALPVIIRAGLLDSAKTQPAAAAAAVFLETLTMMSAGAFLAALYAAVLLRNTPTPYGYGLPLLLSAAIMLLAALPVLPPVFRLIAKKVLPKTHSESLRLTFMTLLTGYLLMIPLWLMLGLSLWAVIHGIGISVPFSEYPQFTAAAAFAMVFGFISMVPGGLGTREFMLVQILTAYFATLPDISEPAAATALAITAAGVQRLVSIIAELIVSALLIPARKKRRTLP
ncbi:MAG: flippase-like domain-containing protein [Planctomycetaceae bacterium]|jgi:uncharacterized membrane protein YbhN (UPF0104 family)|nr:flippase-like domain-containing protein [Planctomycetaceae bacterium]